LNSTDRRVRFQPASSLAMRRGIHQLVNAIRPTLGPLSKAVAVEKTMRSDPPELIDNGAIIARRVVQIRDRDGDMGAMFLRQMLWRLHEKVGDGTATAAVLFQEIFDQGLKYITAGGNAMRLRVHLESLLRDMLDEFSTMTVHVEGKENLARVAEAICYDPALAKLLGEIMDIVGPYGVVDVRSSRGRDLDREYVEGMYWESGLFSREMVPDPTSQRVELPEAAILISNLDIEEARQLLPLIDLAHNNKIKSLVVMARKLSEQAIAMLLAVNKQSKELKTFGVKTPEMTVQAIASAMTDLAILTGGKPFINEAGDTITRVQLDDLGKARMAWGDREFFGIVGGKGDPKALRRHIAELRIVHREAKNADDREALQKRIGKLLGGSATLWIGGMTKTELEVRKEIAERTAKAMRGAITDGVVPGSGVTLLALQPLVRRRLARAADGEEHAACMIMLRALEAPLRALAENAGKDPGQILSALRQGRQRCVYDLRTGVVVDAFESGIFDAASVVKEALYGAVSSAALALTVDVLVHHKKPVTSMEP
jgi:chaperonin GroEL